MKRLQRRGAGEGSIFQRPDGSWVAQIDLGWQNGQRKRPTRYAHTREEVAKKMTKLLQQRDAGLPISTERRTVAQYLESWLKSIKPPQVRPRTYERFEGLVRLHLVPDLGRHRLEQLGPGHVQDLLNRKLAGGLSLQSVKHIRTTLSIALGRAVKWELLSRNVARLTTLPASVALALALRRGEALGLQWSDIDLDAGTLRVNRSLQRAEGRLQLLPPKTKSSRRPFKLPDVTIKALRKHRARQLEERLAAGPEWRDMDLVFTTRVGGLLEPRNVVRHFKTVLQRAGLDPSRFHDLRHTAISLLIAQGVHPRVIMEIAGHSRISTTMDVYGHIMPMALNDAAAKMNSILGGT